MWVQQLNKLGLISMNKLGTLENVADMMTKHVPRGVLDKLAGMMGYSFSREETAKFQDYSSIEQSFWNQKLTTVERLPIFNDEESEELEHDVRSFVDNDSSHVGRFEAECWDVDAVTTVFYRPPWPTELCDDWLGDSVEMTRTNREV